MQYEGYDTICCLISLFLYSIHSYAHELQQGRDSPTVDEHTDIAHPTNNRTLVVLRKWVLRIPAKVRMGLCIKPPAKEVA